MTYRNNYKTYMNPHSHYSKGTQTLKQIITDIERKNKKQKKFLND